MALKVVTRPMTLREWAATQNSASLECRLGRHWVAGIRHKKSFHEFDEVDGCFLVVQPCLRGCLTDIATAVDARTGQLARHSRYRYDPRYKRPKGAGRLTREERGALRLVLLGRQNEADRVFDELEKDDPQHPDNLERAG